MRTCSSTELRRQVRIRLTRSTVVASILIFACLPAQSAAHTFVVNSTADTHDANLGDGICDDGTGACTLRAAAEEAVQAPPPPPSCSIMDEPAVITIAVTGTIVLTTPVSFVSGFCVFSLTINGPGSAKLTISGGGLEFAGRMFGIDIELTGATITNAPIGLNLFGSQDSSSYVLHDVAVTSNGVGIQLEHVEILHMSDSLVTHNIADGLTGNVSVVAGIVRSRIESNGGGGMIVGPFILTISDSIISNNGGPGIETGGAEEPDVRISRSTIDGNGGVGVITNGSATRIVETTISNNRGGGARFRLIGVEQREGQIAIINSTVSGNQTPGDGGGLRLFSLSNHVMEIRNVTITDNVAGVDADRIGTGGGIWVDDGVSVTIANTILSGNRDGSGGAPDCSGTLTSGGYNFIGDITGCNLSGATPLDTFESDPLLGPLEDNGGPTSTHALLFGSPAIDAGDPAGCTDDAGAPLTIDQRGVPRPQFGRCDVGAYEFACGNGVVDLGEECDDGNAIDTDGCSANCLPNHPPSCARAFASPSRLWPPNGRFADVQIEGVTDVDNDHVTINITGVTQDEPVQTAADRNCPDASGIGSAVAHLRAKRRPTGDGRIYRVSFRADDGHLGTCTGTANVCVPHDLGRGARCVEGETVADSTRCGPMHGIVR